MWAAAVTSGQHVRDVQTTGPWPTAKYAGLVWQPGEPLPRIEANLAIAQCEPLLHLGDVTGQLDHRETVDLADAASQRLKKLLGAREQLDLVFAIRGRAREHSRA